MKPSQLLCQMFLPSHLSRSSLSLLTDIKLTSKCGTQFATLESLLTLLSGSTFDCKINLFKLNSINIGLVPIETTEENMDILFDKVNLNSKVEINISINEKKVTCEELEFEFVIDNFSQNRILNGIDKIDISLDYSNMIEQFKENRSTWMPKLTD